MGEAALLERAQAITAHLHEVYRNPRIIKDANFAVQAALFRNIRIATALSDDHFQLTDSEVGSEQKNELDMKNPTAVGTMRISRDFLTDNLPDLIAEWSRTPMKTLAKWHTVAAAGTIDTEFLGVPKKDFASMERLQLLGNVISNPQLTVGIPVPLIVAIVFAEIAVLHPFVSFNNSLAFFAARATAITKGLDPLGINMPETFFWRNRINFRRFLEFYAEGDRSKIIKWIDFYLQGLSAGIDEVEKIL